VDARHPVDGVRAHDAQVRHVDLLLVALLDQGHAAHAVQVAGVELGDALQGRHGHMNTLNALNSCAHLSVCTA